LGRDREQRFEISTAALVTRADESVNDTSHIENVILGGGEPGKYIAWELARHGRPVVVIERALIGGSCPNVACLPSKNIIRSAKVADLVSRGAAYGVRRESAIVEMEGVRRRKREMVEGLIEIHRTKFAVPNLDFQFAEGLLVGPRTVEARLPDGGRKRFIAERLFLNLGTHATIPGVPGLADTAPLTHVGALELGRLPSHLIVLGGGYVGVEFAQAFRRFGGKVTVIEYGWQLLGREDPDVAAAVRAIFEEDGIEVVLRADTQSAEGRSGDRVRLRIKTKGGERTIEGSDILVAAGRTPNTRGIGLEQAGSSLTRTASSRSTIACGRALPGCGRWASARAVRSSHTLRSTTSVWSVTTSRESDDRHRIGSFRTVPSSIPSSRASDSTKPQPSDNRSRYGSPGCR
jgi:pyruvate/2-oxoglutarate dehydrogenase complex dihydrolipoamide dehydrogenase (E3) component